MSSCKENNDLNESEEIPLWTKEENKSANFETAISATGFGKFNIILILIAITTEWAAMFETTSLSYVIPIFRCDLELSLEQKGYLISITYLGTLISAPMWGFLADTYGRKKLITICLLLAAFFNFAGGLSQNFRTIMFTKFMGGFIINGPSAIITTMLSEFHSAKYRATIVLSMGIAYATANLFLPFAAMLVLSQKNDFNIGFLELHSWNLFLLFCGLPALISGSLLILIPESPKFLMAAGRNDDAMKIFKRIYTQNSGKHEDSFPIKKLLEERMQINKEVSKLVAFKSGFANTKPLFFLPHVTILLLVCIIQICIVMSLNTLRLWLPQIFTAINDYKAANNNEEGSICLMLEMIQQNSTLAEEKKDECIVNYDNASVYTDCMIVSLSSIAGYIFVGKLINTIGKKKMLITLGTIAGIAGMSLYFSQNTSTTIALSSIFTTVNLINANVMMTIIVDCFPTTLRTMAISIILMMGRSGAMAGNVGMAHLLSAGCLPPFVFIGLTASLIAISGTFLPNTDMNSLE